MSEQKMEPPAPDTETSIKNGDRFNDVITTGSIRAEAITGINIISGTQHIKTQINVLREQSQPLTPPLQRPRRAEHFVGREKEQAKLLVDLQLGRIVTVCGPGGIGKTALVAEVLWKLAPKDVPPAIFPDGIFFHSFYGQPESSLALEQIARTFGEEPLPTPALAVQRALNQRHALLVLDGVEEADNLAQILAVCTDSAVLVTSQRRSDAPDPAYRLDLKPLPRDKAINVVQAWGGKWARDEAAIRQICERVGDLPLALHLVGRYLAQQEEDDSDYLLWLQEAIFPALDQGESKSDSVPLLIGRTVAKLSANTQHALSVIGQLALAPFNRELVARILHLSNTAVIKALGELVNYGLVIRLDKSFEVSHSLIHTYAREMFLTECKPTQQENLARRVIFALAELFPEATYMNWPVCEKLLPHAQLCAVHIKRWNMVFSEAERLLSRLGVYLYRRAQYILAESVLLHVLGIEEKQPQSEHANITTNLNTLANLYIDLGKYELAEPLLQRTLSLDKKVWGTHHFEVATDLNDLAYLYFEQGKYELAEPLLLQALEIRLQVLGPVHPQIAQSLNNIAQLYREQGRYEHVELLLQQALTIDKKSRGVGHPSVATDLNNLASFYHMQGKHSEAEPLYQQALEIRKQILGLEHPDVAQSIDNLVTLYSSQGRYEEEEPLLRQALAIRRQALGQQHSSTAISLNNLAVLCYHQGRYTEAEAHLKEAVTIQQRALGPEHPDLSTSLNNLAGLYKTKGKYAEAESLYQQALVIQRRSFGAQHPEVALSLNMLAELYHSQRKYQEAESLYWQSHTILEKALGTEHLSVAIILNNLGGLYLDLGKYEQAEPLLRQALVSLEKGLGLMHPDTATCINCLGVLYLNQSKYEQAESLLWGGLAIRKQLLGPKHPDLATSFNNLGTLCASQGRYTEAEWFYLQALQIQEQTLELARLNTAVVLNNYADLLRKTKRMKEARMIAVRDRFTS